jgi:hypothetical protein
MALNLVSQILENGGEIYPLIIPSENTNGTGLCNPSIFNDNGRLLINLRHVQYSFYHTFGKYESRYGPLIYLTPDGDQTLHTTNWLLEWDTYIKTYKKIDTTKLDKPPLWEFVGLEDARIVRWHDTLYLTGVRRDTTTNGEGRMELSEIDLDGNELRRVRIKPPIETYCEKNWMPVVDLPFTYVKWANPTEIVRVVEGEANTMHTSSFFPMDYDLRGGSSVIRIDNYRIAITHRTQFWRNKQNNKQAIYTHNIVIWDLDWNIVKVSKEFNFMNGHIEFCTGMAVKDNDVYITFGYEDAAAYLVKVNKNFLLEYAFRNN